MWEEKKSKCLKKNFQSVKRGKNVSVEFRVFGKKMEIERKVPEKKIKVFWVEKLKLRFAWENLKSGIFIYWVRTHWLGAMLIEKRKFNHMG